MEVHSTELNFESGAFSLDTTLPPVPCLTPWHPRKWQGAEVEVRSHRPRPARPRALAIPISSRKIPIKSFYFDGAPGLVSLTNKPPAKPKKACSTTPKTTTRIKPPNDLVKLEDRLLYVLQPSLESVFNSQSLTFPFDPFPYQLEGIAYLYSRHAAILADEMGLGKTMQAITTIRLLLHAGEIRNVLLVCPKPLVSNWQKEFGLWAPEIPLTIVGGDSHKRRWQWEMTDAPVKIANYELLLRDREHVTAPDTKFDLVVLDEAQRIKNRSSTTSQVVCEIPRSRNWALTGTPIENSAEDLVGIFEYLAPGYLTSETNVRRIGKAAREYTLRRTKDKVLTDMPPRLFRDAEIDLSPEQTDTYRMAEDEGVVRLTEMGDGLTVQHVFELVLRLKQICNFDPATGQSSKMERLEADMEELAQSGQKAIIFSQWVKTLKTIGGHLERFKPLEYHGKIPHKQREGVIERFRNDPDSRVILMSYGAGSVGLNLQFCQYVFLFDRWWNPAVEDQAINRAHRIGVAGPVTVSRFITHGTIEQRIDQVLQEKRELFDSIFSESGKPQRLGMNQAEIFGLFNLKKPCGERLV